MKDILKDFLTKELAELKDKMLDISKMIENIYGPSVKNAVELRSAAGQIGQWIDDVKNERTEG